METHHDRIEKKPDIMLGSARPEIVKIEISRHQKFNISVAANKQ